MDINRIRQVAKTFLYLDIQIDDRFPFIIHHPFFCNPFFFYKTSQYNLTDKNELGAAQEFLADEIDKADLIRLFILIQKPYHLLFYKFINVYLDEKEFAKYLAYVWVNSENPNQDVNVSLNEVKEWFKKANKEYLMEEEDYNYYAALPDKIKIYRGVANNRNPKGISYTDNKETAEWFMNRFGDNGYLIEKEVDKKDIAAYFNTRCEQELVYIGE